MPIYVRKCADESCDHYFELTLPMAAYDADADHPCPKCGSASVRGFLPSYVSAANTEPIVVFKADDNTYRYPGDPSGLSADNYAKLGYERVELRGWADVRRFERTVNSQQASEIARRVERQLEAREQEVKARRSEILNGVRNGFTIPDYDDKGRPTGRLRTVHMSEAGKAILRASMERHDAKPKPRVQDVNFHSEVYSFTRGNRDESRRSDGKRHRD